MKIRMIANIVLYFLVSVSVFAEDQKEDKKIPQKDEIAFYIHPPCYAPRDLYINKDSFFSSWERTGKINKGSNISHHRLSNIKDELEYESGIDDSYGLAADGIPVTWDEFYKTANFKAKQLKCADIWTNKLSHLFAGWNLEGSSLELRGDLTDAVVTKCDLYLFIPDFGSLDCKARMYGEKSYYKNNLTKEEEEIASKAFTVFTSTWNYKYNRLEYISLYGIDLRKGDFYKKDVSKMRFVDCKFFDETNKNEYIFADAVITGNHNNPYQETPNGISKEQLYKTDCYKKKQLKNINVHHLPRLDVTGQNLEGTTFTGSAADYKFDGTYIERTTMRSITKDQLYTTKSYKNGFISKSRFFDADFSHANLSNMNLTGCRFFKCDFKDADFTNSVINNCSFGISAKESGYNVNNPHLESKNLSIEQIKSTWNYKNNRMDGIKLPEEIQKALDAEKQAMNKSEKK
ncbi:MAG: pentapeptide repeat-containing protein [Planctomycetaceae bacterium]|jgi:uncharacterized protein YjbI with pentapeptide repeats|nr:pentapeptide repeat-containing protein [Planctomycetaceae bacterium]